MIIVAFIILFIVSAFLWLQMSKANRILRKPRPMPPISTLRRKHDK